MVGQSDLPRMVHPKSRVQPHIAEAVARLPFIGICLSQCTPTCSASQLSDSTTSWECSPDSSRLHSRDEWVPVCPQREKTDLFFIKQHDTRTYIIQPHTCLKRRESPSMISEKLLKKLSPHGQTERTNHSPIEI